MRKVARSLFLTIAAVSALGILASSAVAKTFDVFPGHSIQKAVNKAHPGDAIFVHPGVYHESVRIQTNNLTLKGSGDTGGGTVLEPGPKKHCGHGAVGICVFSKSSPVRHTLISGFLIRGYKAFGAVGFGVRNTTFSHNAFAQDGEYGGATFGSTGTRFLHNRARGAGEAGFYIGDTPHSGAVLRGNHSRRNHAFGFLFRDASGGVAVDNRASGNCVGFVVVNTKSPGAARNWTLKRNDALKNKRFCPSQEGRPPLSGTGIGLIGARHTRVHNNIALRNRPSGAVPFAGGISLFSSKQLGGSNASHNTISRNRAYKNRPADIVWDGNGTGNAFTGNKCDKSQPPGLCH